MAAGHGDDQVQAQFVRICICAQISNGLWVEPSKALVTFLREESIIYSSILLPLLDKSSAK